MPRLEVATAWTLTALLALVVLAGCRTVLSWGWSVVVFALAVFGPVPVAVDELRLSQVWNGDVVLVARSRNQSEAEAPINIGWLTRMVLREKKSLRDISIASVVLSLLTIFPALIVMQVIDKVVNHHSMSTLV